ncbi:hypothetical protein [Bacillus subtilis]|uniref:hypothetical protein n=1 Tax=Bacillus subtilis TaxID=1423 RepID=UPI004029D293
MRFRIASGIWERVPAWNISCGSGHQTVIGLIHEGQSPAASSFNIVSRWILEVDQW